MFNSSTLARRARLASALSLTALLGAGLWSPTQAAPDPNPPIRGGVDRNNRNRGDVLRGVVSRTYSARSFDLRAENGRTYRVNLSFSVGLETQSQVRVRGTLRGSTFDARTLTVGDFANDRYDDDYNGSYDNGGYDNGQYQGQSVVLRGRVTRVFSRNEIEVRDDDDGRVYRVRTDRALDYSVREGDRIEARGQLNGSTIQATSVGNDYGTNDNRNDATFVNFSGPIESIDAYRQEARVRAGNGYTYTISASRSQLENFRVGQRVRVQGNWINNRVEVTQIVRD